MVSLGMGYNVHTSNGDIILEPYRTVQVAKLTTVIHADQFHLHGSLAASQVGVMITILKEREGAWKGQEICQGYRYGCGKRGARVNWTSQMVGSLQPCGAAEGELSCGSVRTAHTADS